MSLREKDGDDVSSGLEVITRCLHQVFSSRGGYIPIEGVGNCSECEYDPENNVKCRMFYPIKVRMYTVKPGR
ncbi:MAG: hypothetical protein V1729_02955 [Candidatus Woesearchaeota archaeon]